ncbi:alpha/beta fold hydrolase [Flavobacterium selenitireducens]|uniref:alpha/beta fold hydrolase n=1 Tax=Flavobacterium selenitireducens TaxID=2722704 RepID=UPI00168A95B8|nr:alpha/beta fold hydrolase [Flavobacterium selenitireducens]MBD3583871.1 alpha/beta fold hydrolase [Flavobacterium selenitireducens]
MLYSRIEGEGKPLVILHGFLGTSDNWKSLAGQYAAEGYQVHALDMRNHGRSFHSQESTYEAMAEDIQGYVEHHGLKSFDLIGHSMGGKIAMFYAVAHPGWIDKLVVADIGTKYYKPHHQDILLALNEVDFSVKPSRSDVEAIIKKHLGDDQGTIQFLMKNLYWVEPGQLGFRMNLPVLTQKIENIGQALPRDAVFSKPTLFLRGGDSRYVKDEDMPQIREHFPKAVFATIKDAGHWLHAEKPKEFFDATLYFLKQ